MTSPNEAPRSWMIRPGSIVDVPAVARLLRASRRPIDIDGDGTLDGPTNRDAADTAARLILLHGVLERGELWIAERGGRPVAAAVWVPGGVVAGSGDLGGILRRELKVGSVEDVADLLGPEEHVRPFVVEAIAGAHELVAPEALVLYALVIEPQAAEVLDRVALARELVGPVLLARAGAALDDDANRPYAFALDPGRARLLEQAGFRAVDAVPLGLAHTVWVGRAERRAPVPA